MERASLALVTAAACCGACGIFIGSQLACFVSYYMRDN